MKNKVSPSRKPAPSWLGWFSFMFSPAAPQAFPCPSPYCPVRRLPASAVSPTVSCELPEGSDFFPHIPSTYKEFQELSLRKTRIVLILTPTRKWESSYLCRGSRRGRALPCWPSCCQHGQRDWRWGPRTPGQNTTPPTTRKDNVGWWQGSEMALSKACLNRKYFLLRPY